MSAVIFTARDIDYLVLNFCESQLKRELHKAELEAFTATYWQDDDTAMEYQLRRIDKAWPKLDILCLTLIASGFTSCLYGTPRCGPAADNDYFCYVCPCSLAWWKAEPAAKQIGNMS